MTRIFPVVTYAACGLLLITGCSVSQNDKESQQEKNPVVVTIPPLEYFVENIGGDRVEVECLAPASADPETFEPSMAQLRKASHAGLLLTVGLLPFEERVSETVSASNPGIKIASLSDSVELIEGTHDHGPRHNHHHDGHSHGESHDAACDGDESHGNYDPHVWTSLRNARIMARNTCRALTERFPADSIYFKARLDSLDHHLDSLDRQLSSRLKPLKGEAILVWHPSLSYFARDYGLRQLALGQEHKEFSITGLKERLDNVRKERPLVFFYQREYDSRQSRTISEATGLPPVVITPLSPDIEEAVCKAADALTATEKQSRPASN